MIRRLLLGYLTLAALVLLSLEIPLGYVYSRAERERIITAAEDEAESVAAFASLSITAGREGRLRRRVTHCAERIGGTVLIVGARGQVLATSRPLSAEQQRNAAARPELTAALNGHDAFEVRTSTIGGVRNLSVAAPIGHGDRPQGAVWLTVPTDAVEGRVHRVWLILALAGSAILVAVAVAALVFARWTSRPIRELERAAHRLADGERATPAPATCGPPEVRSLAVTFNQTAARLEHLLTSQRAFAAEASHQLKTPLAALRLRLDNLEPDVSGHARDSLTAAMTETDRLARMVEGLLDMARLEEGAVVPEPVDIDQVCTQRLLTWAPLFEREDARLVLIGGRVGHALAAPGAVEQILDNLLSNALRAIPAGGTVTLVPRLSASDRRHLHLPGHQTQPSWVEVHVIDEGPGMTAEQRRRAFDRFWRAPDAPKGGTGLGLSLVQRLAHVSGGEATLTAAPGGGLDAAVRLRPVTRTGAGRPARIGLGRKPADAESSARGSA
ncbi:HAMP domain-containing histidine kinase [Streptomyces sp. NA02950]|uniref:sensor histidine kinase n=1 Tax=Streptomyces sp. NA02950 TaxID=2742137 RepID=UPI00158FE99D|nr:HAMP domain-containing sensor histidine kinase [Streptomyces sp. NA02950]QKV91224.1 HAMP domain-containing histidine kinase [Streptomyces sp. NA02950]